MPPSFAREHHENHNLRALNFNKFKENPKCYFLKKVLKNNIKVLLKSFHSNDHTIGFYIIH